jgi:hypothetical protein
VDFHNGTLKKPFNAKLGSVLTLDYLFEYCGLNTDFFDYLIKYMESFYSVNRGSEHLEKSAGCDIRVVRLSITSHSGRRPSTRLSMC